MKKIFTLISVALLCLSASAQVNLATAIEDAVKASSDEYCSVFLDHTKEYVLDSNVDLGLQKAVIWGCGAKVTVKGEGQLSTQTYLQVRSVNFLCAEATKAIIALSATPDESLKINDETSAIKFEGANQKVYWIDNQVSVILCNFVDLGQSLIYANKQPYALANLKIDQCVVQLRGSKIDPVINWVGSNTGAIKNIVLSNNTIYNVSQDNTSSWMIRYGNASNAQPQKVWGTDAFSRFQMYNNTICFPGKALANNFPNKNNVYLTWKKNIFINTPYLQKTASNAVREFTNADNVLYATEGFTIDNTDKEKYGTVEDLAIVPPTESLNIDNIFTLKNVFAPKFETIATNSQYGDPRWVTPFKDVIAKTPGYGYEVVLGPDMLDLTNLTLVGNCNEADLGKVKPGIDTVNYPWIKYVRGDDKNILSNGQHEAQKSNRWTDLNPTTGERGTWLQATGKNGSVESPVISGEWNKWMVVFVKNLTTLKVFATGSASSTAETKVRLVVKAMGTDGTVIEAATAEGSIYGKGTASDVCQVELNPEVGYMVEISSVSPGNKKDDIQITGLQLHGVDTTPFPVCHAPGEKAPGTNYEVVLGPDMLAEYALVSDPATTKPGINVEAYPWITYTRGDGLNALENGQYEAQKSNRWTDLNPTTGERGTWLQATGKNGSVESPVISGEWNKWMVVFVKNLTTLKVFATGSASSTAETKVRLVVKAMGTDGTVIEAATAEGSIYGKGTASDVCQVELNPEVGYMVEISSVSPGNKKDDIQITGLQLHGVDTTPFPVCHAPGEKAPGTNYEVVLGPDMLAEYALVSDPATTKPGINVEAYPWITYTRGDGLNALENGQYEAQQSNRWTDLNPTTGEKCEFIQATGKNGSVNSPVVSAQWNKWMEAAIMDATSFRVYATGSASTTAETGEQLILTATANDGTVVKTATTPGTIWGKGKGSDCATLKLDPSKAYVVKIEAGVMDIQITGFNITGTDLSIAPVEEEPGMGDATGIENVETAPVQNGRIYNVLGQEVKTAKGLVIKNGKKYIVR